MVFGVGVGLGVLDARMLRIAAVLAMDDAVARGIDAVYVLLVWYGPSTCAHTSVCWSLGSCGPRLFSFITGWRNMATVVARAAVGRYDGQCGELEV